MADVINKIQTEILGEEEVHRLTGLIEAQEKAFLALARSMQAAGASEAQVRAATRAIAGDIAKLNDQLAAVGGGPRSRNQGLLQFGRIAQDLQYGFSAVVNNLVEVAPLLGVVAVGAQVVAANAGKAAEEIGKWKDSLGEGQEGFKDTLSVIQAAIGGMDMSMEHIKEGIAGVFETVGAGGVTAFLRGDPLADRLKAEEKAGREAIGGIVGKEDQERMKAMRETIEQFGGGPKFMNMLTEGMNKEKAAEMYRQVDLVRMTGEAGTFGAIQKQLGRQGGLGPDAAFAMEANLPANRKQAEEMRRAREEGEKEALSLREAHEKEQQRLAGKEFALAFQMNKDLNADEKREAKEDAQIMRRNEERELSGRMKWVETLQRERAQTPKIHGDMMSAVNALQTASKGKDPQLEQIHKDLEMQLTALKESARVGP